MFLAIIAIIIPTVTGSQTYTVLTRSMEPDYPPGTYLVVRPTPADQLKVGDVITYQIESGKPAVVTHRIVSSSQTSDGERRFITKGDNNSVNDPESVRPVQIRGSLWYAIPYLGWATGLRSENSSAIWIPIAAGILVSYAAFMVGSWAVDRRKAKKAAAAKTPTGIGEGPLPPRENQQS